jgi:hypothetical protein
MAAGSVSGRAGCPPGEPGQDIPEPESEQHAAARHSAQAGRRKCLFVFGALLAVFVGVSRSQALDCLPTADAVKQQYPGSWPSWTSRAPGHAAERCWYPASRTTAHQHPKWTQAPVAARKAAEPLESPEETSGIGAPVALTDIAAIQRVSVEVPVSAPRANAVPLEFIAREKDLALEPQVMAQLMTGSASAAPGAAHPTFSGSAALVALVGALGFASILAAFFATFQIGERRQRPSPVRFRTDNDLVSSIGSNAETNNRRPWRTAASPWD